MSNASNDRERLPWLFKLLGRLSASWVQIRSEPADVLAQLKADVPVVYVTERYGLSNAIILEQACREAGLPSPLLPPGGPDVLGKERALVALSRRRGLWFGRPRSLTHSRSLALLLQNLRERPDLDVQIVPVSIFVGRAPARHTGWFRVLFAENWVMVGRFRRFLSVLLNGRDTMVQFAAPISARSILAEEDAPERLLRKLQRVLRTHFRRIRAAVVGPDLSHRRTLIDSVLGREAVQRAIAETARKDQITLEKARSRARSFALEVAADYSHTVVRSASFILTGFWNKIYDGVHVHHFDTLRRAAPGHEVIYVPCHRSHIDYLLLSYQLYRNGIVPPHIAAGVNLNLPLVGPLLRRGGAFFLRRSFKSNALYSTVFSEYVATLVQGGVSIEYFIEGGRSRTGRLLSPKAGMLAMTVRAYLRQPRKPVMFQPVYIGYEKLIEGRSYLDELSGRPKQKESIWVLLRSAIGVMRKQYGRVALSFGKPIYLDDVLASHAQDWREQGASSEARPEWFNPAVDDLARRILVQINSVADVNPVNLLGMSLLATPKQAMAESDLIAQLALFKRLLAAVPYSDRVTVTEMDPAQIIAQGERLQVLSRVQHPLGDVLRFEGDEAILQSYFRNNVVHLFSAAAWVACCFQNSRRMSRAGVIRLGRLLYPFVQNELFLPWSEEEFSERLQATITVLIQEGLLGFDEASGMLERGPGQTDEVFRLRVVAHGLQQAFERYYIAIAILVKNGPRTLSPGELENACQMTAQRLGLLFSQTAPEFFDRALFRGFIGKLRELGFVWNGADGKLDFDERMEGWSRDARIVLGRELRHSILKISPEPVRELPSESSAA